MNYSQHFTALSSPLASIVSDTLPSVSMCSGSTYAACMSKLKLAFMQRGPTYVY